MKYPIAYHLRHIYALENESLRLCLGAFKTSTITSLHVEASEPPFQLRCIKDGFFYATSILANPLNPSYYLIRTPSLSNLFSLNKCTAKPPLGIHLLRYFKNTGVDASTILKSSVPSHPPWTISTSKSSCHSLPSRNPTFNQTFILKNSISLLTTTKIINTSILMVPAKAVLLLL